MGVHHKCWFLFMCKKQQQQQKKKNNKTLAILAGLVMTRGT